MFRLCEDLSVLVHCQPQGAELCQVKGLYPNKFVLFGERMLLSLGRLYEKTFNFKVSTFLVVKLFYNFKFPSKKFIFKNSEI